MNPIPVPPSQARLPLDEFLALRFPGHSLKLLRRLVAGGKVLVNGERASRELRLREGDSVSVDLPSTAAPRYRAGSESAAEALEVLYEDERVLAIAKPAGLAVGAERIAPGIREDGDADRAAVRVPIMDLLLDYTARLSPFGAELRRPRLVHRLDRDTSGVLLVAMSADSARSLSGAFEAGTVAKTYHALVQGCPVRAEGEVALPLRPASRGNVIEVGAQGGKAAFTAWRVLETYGDHHALVEARPRTGRTHQIRVHLAAIGHPLAVDPSYGRSEALLLSSFKRAYKPARGRRETPLIDRLTLHAAGLEIAHPFTGESMNLAAPWPEDFARALKQLRKWGS